MALPRSKTLPYDTPPDGGIAFDEGDADTAKGLSCEAGHGDGCDSGGHVELKKAGIDGQNHDQGKPPNKQ